MKRIYLSGPIAGMADGGRSAFREAQSRIEKGYGGTLTVSPLEIPCYCLSFGESESEFCRPDKAVAGYRFENGHRRECWLRADLIVMLQGCDTVIMLPGWKNSVGCRIEHRVALEAGLNVYHSIEEWEKGNGSVTP